MFESRLELKGVKGFSVQWFLSGTDVSGDRGHGYSPNSAPGTGARPFITPGMLLGVAEPHLLQGWED